MEEISKIMWQCKVYKNVTKISRIMWQYQLPQVKIAQAKFEFYCHANTINVLKNSMHQVRTNLFIDLGVPYFKKD